MSPTKSVPVRPRWLVASVWIGAYVLLCVLPLLVLIAGPLPRGAGRWWDLSMALGFAGLAMLGLQFALTARFRRATAPFGVDIIYFFHRWAAVGAVGLVIAHYLIVKILYGPALGPASPFEAPWALTAGRASLLLFGAVIVTSLWRKALRLPYDGWRLWHGMLSTLAVLLAILHVAGAGRYTATPWKATLWTGYTVLWVLLIGYVRILKPAAQLRRPWRVSAVIRERGDSWTVEVTPASGGVFAYRPGQFAWLAIGDGPFRAREHPFSISGSAEDRRVLRFTIKELGDFTRTIGRTPVGSVAYVDGPYGVFCPDQHPEAPGFVLIAGGIGIAPIMGMLRTFADRGERRPLRLVHGNASWERATFREEIEQLATRLPLAVVPVVQDPPPGWTGLQGVLDAGVLRAAVPESDVSRHFFVCGPKAMTDSVQRSLRARGVPLRRIHTELFDMA